jgi:hypothetical protein
VLYSFEKARDVLSSQNFAIDGRNGMDSPLYGSTAMSHNAFAIRAPIETQGEECCAKDGAGASTWHRPAWQQRSCATRVRRA